MYNNDVGKGEAQGCEACEVKQRVALVRVPFYFINLLPTSLLYISILLAYASTVLHASVWERVRPPVPNTLRPPCLRASVSFVSVSTERFNCRCRGLRGEAAGDVKNLYPLLPICCCDRLCGEPCASPVDTGTRKQGSTCATATCLYVWDKSLI